MKSQKTITHLMLLAASLLSKSLYADPVIGTFSMDQRNYSVVESHGKKVVVPMDLVLDLKARGSRADCAALRTKINQLKPGFAACQENAESEFCKSTLQVLAFYRSSNKSEGNYKWYPATPFLNSSQKEPLKQKVSQSYNTSKKNVVIDVSPHFTRTPTLVLGDHSIGQALLSLGAPASTAVTLVPYLHDGFTDDKLIQTNGLDTACDLLEGNASLRFDESIQGSANASSSMHFAYNQVLEVSRSLEKSDPIKVDDPIERAAVMGARLASAMSSLEAKIDVTDENVIDLFRITVSSDMQPIHYDSASDVIQKWFNIPFEMTGTWIGRAEK